MKKAVVGELLTPLVGPESLRSAFRRRKDAYEYLKIPPGEQKRYLQENWQVHKEMVSHLWLKRLKSAEAMLEDRIWCLFYRMGYTRISDEDFQIKFKSGDGTFGTKRISVLAFDDETAVVVECKAREHRGRRALQKDIDDLASQQKRLASSIRSSLGKNANPKIIWLFATSNIIWAEKDAEQADDANIRVITENELQYFEAFVAHIGTAGRYQFLAEFLEGQEIPNLQNVRVPAVKGRFGAHNRDNLAHHYVMSANVSDNPLGKAIKKSSRIDMRMKSQKSAPMTIEQINDFQDRLGVISDDLLTQIIRAVRWWLLNSYIRISKLLFGAGVTPYSKTASIERGLVQVLTHNPTPTRVARGPAPSRGGCLLHAAAAISCRRALGWSGCACRRTARGRRRPCPCSCPASASSFPCCCASGLSPWRPPGWMIRKRMGQCSAFAVHVPLPLVGKG
jgi:hypothetical protein